MEFVDQVDVDHPTYKALEALLVSPAGHEVTEPEETRYRKHLVLRFGQCELPFTGPWAPKPADDARPDFSAEPRHPGSDLEAPPDA